MIKNTILMNFLFELYGYPENWYKKTLNLYAASI